ncbi:MAG TPA: DUF3037 domain-containing protein [Bryobacteraceae bacterium]|nr:DUF3037 domain-containing protein [Bryobacteraceae bacterium]
MPAQHLFDYAVFRLVPRVEREEFLNAGVVLFCPERDYLGARTYVDERKLLALWPEVDLACVKSRLIAVTNVAAGNSEAGPLGQLNRRQRFHWLVSPRSTILQVSPVHTGLCIDPASTLEDLFRQLVL